MRWHVLAAIVVAFGLALPSATQAEPVRIPTTGVPAFAFDAPAGWRITYDQHSNLGFVRASVAMQLTVLADADRKRPLDALAAEVIKAAEFPASARQQAGAIAGRAGQTYFTSKIENGVRTLLDFTLARLDPAHVACLARIKREHAAPAEVAALDALISAVRLTGVK
jgi:hypothetical protein